MPICEFLGMVAADADIPPGYTVGDWQDPTSREQYVTAGIGPGVVPSGYGFDVVGINALTDAHMLAAVGESNPFPDCDVALDDAVGPDVHWGAFSGFATLKEELNPLYFYADIATGHGTGVQGAGVPTDWVISPIWPATFASWPIDAVGFQYQDLMSEILGPVAAKIVVNLVFGPATGDPRYAMVSLYQAPFNSGKPAWTATPIVDPTNLIDDLATAASYPHLGDFAVSPPFPMTPLGALSDLQPLSVYPGVSGINVRGLPTAAVAGLPRSPDTFGVRFGYNSPSVWIRMPLFRWIYCGVHQRNFPRDDGLGISGARSFPPQVDSIRSYPHIP